MKHFKTKLNLTRAAMTLLAAVLCLTGARADLVQIGSGSGYTTSYLPGYNYYNYSYSQQIYTYDEIGTAGTINSIAFYNGNTEKTRTYAIYMQLTDKDTFASTTDWVAMSADDKVFEGSLTFTNGVWTTITLDTPFEYDGDSNLIVAVADITGNYSESPHMGCLYLEAKGQALSSSRDASPYDVSAPGVQGTLRDFKNQLQIDITPGAGPSITKPRSVAVNYTGGTTAEVTWTSSEPAFDIDVNGTVTQDVTSPYTLSDLALATTYTVKLRSKNGSEVSDWTTPVSFTTEACLNPMVINYSLSDSYGDGWNGNAIEVIDENEDVVATLTITTGSSASGTLKICGTYARFEWVAGQYASEASWTFTDEKGVTLFSGNGNTSMATGDILYEIDNSDCKKPKNLTVSDITYSSVTLTWEGESAEGWVIGYVADDPTEEYELVNGVTANTYTITGLDPETLYYVAVRPSCDISKWCDQVSFTTPEQFARPTDVAVSNVTTNSADISWTADADATGADLQYGIATIEYNEYKYDNGTMGTQINAGGSPFDYAIMLPAGSYSGNVLTKVSVFDYAASAETITIYNDGTTAPEGEIASKPLTLTGSRSFVEVSFDDVVLDVTKNLWIVVSNNSGNAVAAAADDLNDANGRWTALVSWDDLAELGASGYVWMIHAEIKSVDTSSTEWTTVNGVTSPYQLTGLADDTAYAVQVRSTYADGASKWSETCFTTISNNPLATNVVAEALHTTATISWEGESESYKVKYRTAADVEKYFFDDFEGGQGSWTTSNLQSGSGVLNGAGVTGGKGFAFIYTTNPPQYLISPELSSIDAGAKLKFSYANYNAEYPESFKVGYSTTTNDLDAFTWSEETTVSGTSWNEYELTLPADVKYVSIQCTSYDMWYLFIDNIGIYGDDIPAGEWQEVAADETSVELTGLEMGTEYEYTVIGIKGGSENAGTAVKTFTTLSENDKIFTTAGNWDEAENWTPAGVPTATNNLIIRADAVVPAGVIATANNVTIDGGSITIKDGGELKQNSDIEVTLEKNIAGYGDGEGKFSLISSPVAYELLSTDIEGLLEDNYDYYRFVRTMNLEWRSYQLTSFNLTPGNGALYANKEDKTLKFTGETWPSVDNYLSMDVTYNANYPLNVILAGNPFPCTGTIYFMDNDDNTSGFIYKLNAAGDGFDVYYGYVSVAPGEAVLVEYGASGTIFYESEDYGDGPALDADDYIVLPQHGVMDTNPDAGPVIPLADNATNNGEYIAAFNGKNIIAKLDGRTLYKDGNWNTICLPFNVTLASSPLAGATAKTLTAATMTGTTVNLTFGADVDVLQANVPYIIKWDSGENIVNPTFPYVTIANADEDARTVSLADGNVKFVGYYDAFDITADDDNIYYMGSGNTLKYTGVDRTLKAFRAYFDFTENAASRQFILDFGDGNTTTGIAGVADDSQKNGEWYTVDGMKLDKQPTRKGLYINNGKKMVIK